MRVPSTGDEGQGRVLNRISCLLRFQEDGLEVPFEMVYTNQGNVSYNANRLRVGEADEKGADEPGANCGRYGAD
jgi:hypothetical protein